MKYIHGSSLKINKNDYLTLQKRTHPFSDNSPGKSPSYKKVLLKRVIVDRP